jgi:hypothetical protein
MPHYTSRQTKNLLPIAKFLFSENFHLLALGKSGFRAGMIKLSKSSE